MKIIIFLKFKTILSHFALERGPFLKTRGVKPLILQKSVAVVDGWVKTRGNTVYVRHSKKSASSCWKVTAQIGSMPERAGYTLERFGATFTANGKRQIQIENFSK